MRLVQLYERAINWPTPRGFAIALAVAALFVIGGLIVSFAKRAWFGRGLGFLGLCMIMGELYVIREQTVTDKPSDHITVTRYRHSERMRRQLALAMAALPCAAAAVMWLGYAKARYRLRRQVPSYLKAGRSHFAQKEYEAALREYNRAIHAAPELAEAYCRRGLVYHEMGQTAQAMKRPRPCDRLRSATAAAYLERGKSRTESGDLDGALADFGQLMIMRADDPETYLHRGVCLVKKGLLSEAAAEFRRVLKLTNHSDFAEPAKNYLRQIEDQHETSLPPPAANGASSFPASPLPRAQDHAFDRPN